MLILIDCIGYPDDVIPKELIDNKQLADFFIKCLILKYPEAICKQSRDWDFNTEIEYIVMNKARNEFIKNLALSLKASLLRGSSSSRY